MLIENPMGLNGLEFIQLTSSQPKKLAHKLEALGFHQVAQHHTQSHIIYQQHDIRLIIQTSADELVQATQEDTYISAYGLRVRDAKLAFLHTLKSGAKPCAPLHSAMADVPAIHATDKCVLYFIEHQNHSSNYNKYFSPLPIPIKASSSGLTYIDHITQYFTHGQLSVWVDFYKHVFNFRELYYVDGKYPGLKTKALCSPCGKIKLLFNEELNPYASDTIVTPAQIQCIALATNDIYKSVNSARQKGVDFFETPAAYYESLSKNMPKLNESIERLKENHILVEGTTNKNLLLQTFTQLNSKQLFLEIIQRKGEDGFGEGNFYTLFNSLYHLGETQTLS